MEMTAAYSLPVLMRRGLVRACAWLALALAAVFTAALLAAACPSQAHADYRLITGEEFFDNDETRGAVCELFVKDSPYTSLSVNREHNEWEDGTWLGVRTLGTSSKFLFEWDPNCNNNKGGFKITAVIDQENDPDDVGLNPGSEATTQDGKGPYVWDGWYYGQDGYGNYISHVILREESKDATADIANQRWALYKNDEDDTYYINNLGYDLHYYVSLDEKYEDPTFGLNMNGEDATAFEIYRIAPADTKSTYFGYADAWMSNLPDDVLLSSVNIPGTHDTGTAHVDTNIKEQVCWKRDQKLFYQEQLNVGARAFDIRCESPDDNDRPDAKDITIKHNIVTCIDRDNKTLTLQKIWDQTLDFLAENNRETVILDICGDEDVSWAMAQLIRAEIERGDDCRIWRGMGVPTVGQARGKIVLLREYDISAESYGLSHIVSVDDYGLDITTGLSDRYANYYASPVTLSDSSADTEGYNFYYGSGPVLYIQSAYRVDREPKWANYVSGTLKQTTENIESENFGDRQRYVMNQTNCTGNTLTDNTLNTSRYINERIYNNEGGYFSNKFTGMVNFNYIDAPLAKMVYSTNFAEGADFFVKAINNATLEFEPEVSIYDFAKAEQCPEVTVTLDGKRLVEGTDYEVEYKDNVFVGTATCYVKGIGDYAGVAVGHFDIKYDPTMMWDGQASYDDYTQMEYCNEAPPDPEVYHDPAYPYSIYIRYYDRDGNLLDDKPVNSGFYYVEAYSPETAFYVEDSIRMPSIITPVPVLALVQTERKDDGILEIQWFGWGMEYGIQGSVDFEVTYPDGTIYRENVAISPDSCSAYLTLSNVPEDEITIKADYVPDEHHNYVCSSRTLSYNGGKTNRNIIGDDVIELDLNEPCEYKPYPSHDEGAYNEWDWSIVEESAKLIDDNALPTVSISTGFKGNEFYFHAENAGTALLELTLDDRYGVYNQCKKYVKVTVNPRDLTVKSSACDAGNNPVTSIQYGAASELTYKIAASVGGSEVDVTDDGFTDGHGYLEVQPISEKASVGPNEIAIIKVGTGSITHDGQVYENVFVSRNYRLKLEPGLVEIGKAPATLVAKDTSGVYGAAEPVYTFTLEGLKEWDSPDAVLNGANLTATLKDGRVYESLPPGSYDNTIMPEGSLPDDSNYYVDTRKNGDLTIAKGDPQLAITPTITEKFYDGTSNGTSKEDFSSSCVENFDGDAPAFSWERWDSNSHQYSAMTGNPVDAGNYRLLATTNETFLYNASTATSEVIVWPASQGDPTIDAPSLTYTGDVQVLGKVTAGKYGDEVHYSLDVPLDNSNYQNYPTTAPTAKNVGTYNVYYYITPIDNNHYRFTGNYKIEITEPDETFTVTYSANGGTGDVPIDSNIYVRDNSATVLGNTGGLAKIGSVFSGWNTKADGTGTDYAEGSSITMESDVILYAKWTSPEYEVIEGKSITHTKGSGVSQRIRIDRPLEDFDSVWIDGIKLDPSKYTAESGSTIITFGDDYLSTLPAGDLTLEYAFTEGLAHSTITVAENNEAAKTSSSLATTGDHLDITPWAALTITSATVIIGIFVCRRKNAQ